MKTEIFEAPRARPGARTFANVIVTFTGLILFALATWTGSTLGGVATGEDRRSVVPWLLHGLSGLLAVFAVFVAQRRAWGRLGQVMLVMAGAMPIAAVLAFRYTGPWSWVGFVMPALLLLACVPFLGPMPPPGREER
jgi:hypothetical protein